VFENDALKKLQARRKALEAILASDDLEVAKAAYDKAEAALDQDVRQSNEDRRWSWSTGATDTSRPEYIRRQELQRVRDQAGVKMQELEFKYAHARDELAELASQLDSTSQIKTCKREYADAGVALQDLQDAISSHAQLLDELPKEIAELEQRRKDAIAKHAKAEATTRAAKQPVPAFPAEIGQFATEIEMKQATLVAAKETHSEARETLPAAREAVVNARSRLRSALHAKAKLEFEIRTADLGAFVAMLVATASPYEKLASDRAAEVTATAEQVAAAEAQVAKEFE
jgi:chromosome segregation ATPase